MDKYGRSPLHVASAVDYVDMVEFLLENGARVDGKTFGECQTALHFAAKNDAVNAIKMLLAHKSDINCTDYKERTPLQVFMQCHFVIVLPQNIFYHLMCLQQLAHFTYVITSIG